VALLGSFWGCEFKRTAVAGLGLLDPCGCAGKLQLNCWEHSSSHGSPHFLVGGFKKCFPSYLVWWSQPPTNQFQNPIKRCPKYAALGAGPLVVRVHKRSSWPLVEGAPRTIKLPNRMSYEVSILDCMLNSLINNIKSWSLTGTRWQWWSSW